MLVTRHPARHPKNETGSTLVTVVIVMLVITLLALVSAAVVTNTARSLVSTRSNAQSKAAADAGLAAVIAAFKKDGACPSPAPSSTTDGLVYETGCTPSSSEVEFAATGYSGAAETETRARYAVIPSVTPPTAGGPGLFYTYNMATRMNSFTFNEADSEVGIDEFIGAGGVYASSGNTQCGSGTVLPADVYVKNGSLFLEGGGCQVKGNAYVSGKVTVQSGAAVEGSIVTSAGDVLIEGGTVGTNSSSGGNILLGGTFTVNGGTVYGSVSAAGSGNSTLGSGTIHGNFIYKGTYGIWGTPANTIVKGAITKSNGLTAPTLPEIPDWQDVEFTPVNATTPPQAWADEGYKLTTVTGTACNKWSTYQEDVTSLTGSLSSKMIFDIRSCSGGFSTNDGGRKDVKVNQDIAIIANRWYLSGAKLSSADGQPHTIFLITPDSQPTVAGPQCNSPAQGSEQGNASTVDPKLAVYLYTPCTMKLNDSSSTFRGQIYAGSLDFGGGVNVAFAPRNIPGYDFGKDVDPWPGGGGAGGVAGLEDHPLWQRDVPVP